VKIICLLLFSLLPFSSAAWAATYYAGPEGGGSSCTQRAPCTIDGGLRKMSGGDTLVLLDGVYRGVENMMSETAHDPPALPPSGSEGAFTTIRAEHVGQAIVDGEYRYSVVANVNSDRRARNYLHFDGIHFRHGRDGLFSLAGSHNWISNCGFEDGMSPGSDEELFIARIMASPSQPASYNLVEDCWVWGRGRYGFYLSGNNTNHPGTDHNVLRRVVVRLDSTPRGHVVGGFRFYSGHDNSCLNCIMIDSLNNAPSEAYAFGTGGGASLREFNHLWSGCIALNNPAFHGFAPEKIDGPQSWVNGIVWGGLSGYFSSPNGYSGAALIDRTTFGANSNITVRHRPNYRFEVRLRDSLIVVPAGGTAFQAPSAISNTYLFLAKGATLGENPGGFTPLKGSVRQAGLSYLPRVERGSLLKSRGAGAEVLYLIGAAGSFAGDPGWNDTTEKPLWPLPNERLWAGKMREYAASGPGGERGFAALTASSSAPLTDYVWNYLGGRPAIVDGKGIYDQR